MIDELQDKVKARLAADSFFDGVDILTEKIGDIENKIERDLGRLGLAVVVLSPRGTRAGTDDRRSIPFLRIQITVSVVENVPVNTGDKKAMDVVKRAIEVLHNSRESDGRSGPVFFLEDDALQLVPDPDGLLVYLVNFFTEFPLR